MRLLTIPELAEILRVPVPRAYNLTRKGRVPVVRLGRQVRVSEDALREFVARGGTAPRAKPGTSYSRHHVGA
jgi:excisionase family DNA binding protein